MPNNDLILRSDVLDLMQSYGPATYDMPYGSGDMIIRPEDVMALPAVDAVPVVHGRWLVDEDPHDGDVRCSRCSVCIDALHERHWPTLKALGYTLSSFYPYCPWCGAKMDGGD